MIRRQHVVFREALAWHATTETKPAAERDCAEACCGVARSGLDVLELHLPVHTDQAVLGNLMSDYPREANVNAVLTYLYWLAEDACTTLGRLMNVGRDAGASAGGRAPRDVQGPGWFASLPNAEEDADAAPWVVRFQGSCRSGKLVPKYLALVTRLFEPTKGSLFAQHVAAPLACDCQSWASTIEILQAGVKAGAKRLICEDVANVSRGDANVFVSCVVVLIALIMRRVQASAAQRARDAITL